MIFMKFSKFKIFRKYCFSWPLTWLKMLVGLRWREFHCFAARIFHFSFMVSFHGAKHSSSGGRLKQSRGSATNFFLNVGFLIFSIFKTWWIETGRGGICIIFDVESHGSIDSVRRFRLRCRARTFSASYWRQCLIFLFFLCQIISSDSEMFKFGFSALNSSFL